MVLFVLGIGLCSLCVYNDVLHVHISLYVSDSGECGVVAKRFL